MDRFPGGGAGAGSFVLGVIAPLQAGMLREGLRCALPGSWSPLIGWWQGGGSLATAAGPEAARVLLACFCCSSGPGGKAQLRPRCYF